MTLEFVEAAINFDSEIDWLNQNLEYLKGATSWAMACGYYHYISGIAWAHRSVAMVGKEDWYKNLEDIQREANMVFKDKVIEFCGGAE
jgi:hypothetical protein